MTAHMLINGLCVKRVLRRYCSGVQFDQTFSPSASRISGYNCRILTFKSWHLNTEQLICHVNLLHKHDANYSI